MLLTFVHRVSPGWECASIWERENAFLILLAWNRAWSMVVMALCNVNVLAYVSLLACVRISKIVTCWRRQFHLTNRSGHSSLRKYRFQEMFFIITKTWVLMYCWCTWALVSIAGQCLSLVLELSTQHHNLPSFCLSLAAGTPICPLAGIKVTFSFQH